MFDVYVIQSIKDGRYYIGHAEDARARLNQHNTGRVDSTKGRTPWYLVRIEQYPTRSEAFRREHEIKSYKGGIKFKKLIGIWRDKYL